MSVSPENDQDGVDQDGVDRPESGEVHGNTRSSAEGVEEKPDTGEGGASPGLIGNGAAVDPRYTAQR
ncbi:MAG TPA: hypothetical protein VNA20_15570 [Frankiaceae bacterium]|nr:hypothetical protein [Frankiaceae bacterium]